MIERLWSSWKPFRRGGFITSHHAQVLKPQNAKGQKAAIRAIGLGCPSGTGSSRRRTVCCCRLMKSEPEIFCIAARRLRAERTGGWMVGDHPAADIAGTQATGLKTAGLTRQGMALRHDRQQSRGGHQRCRAARSTAGLSPSAGEVPRMDNAPYTAGRTTPNIAAAHRISNAACELGLTDG